MLVLFLLLWSSPAQADISVPRGGWGESIPRVLRQMSKDRWFLHPSPFGGTEEGRISPCHSFFHSHLYLLSIYSFKQNAPERLEVHLSQLPVETQLYTREQWL